MFKITREAYGIPFPLIFFFPWIFFSFKKKERVGGMHKILFTSFFFFFIKLPQNRLVPLSCWVKCCHHKDGTK